MKTSYVQELEKIPVSINGVTIRLIDMLQRRIVQMQEICNSLSEENALSNDFLSARISLARAVAEKQIFHDFDGRIADGAFKGLKYLPFSNSSVLAPKLLGTYECEVTGYLKSMAANIDSFIDIGCAEGFYIAGMAYYYPKMQIAGVDIDQSSLDTAKFLCDCNQVSSVSLYKSIGTPLRLAFGKCWIMIDVDGGECEMIKHVVDLISLNHSVNSFTLIIETDLNQDGISNKEDILNQMRDYGMTIEKIFLYDIINRFSPLMKGFTEFERFACAYERTISDQSWIVASKNIN